MAHSSTIIVVLGIKGLSIAKLIERALVIARAMAANTATFPAPVPTLVQFLASVAALSEAQTAFKNHVGPRSDRDDKKLEVVLGLGQLQAYVKVIVNAHPTSAEVIASQAAMTIWKRSLHNKEDLIAKQTVSGAVIVVAKAQKGAKTNEWSYSLDGGKTWLDAPPTTKAKTTIGDLAVGTVVLFRHRVVTKAGRGDWCQPISKLVT